MRLEVEKFLKKHKLLPESVDMNVLCKFIMAEMRNGLAGKDSSLAMLDSYCSPIFSAGKDETVIVIDAGGTNLRTCSVALDKDGNAQINDFQKCKMPGIDKEVSASEFFSVIADELERLIDKADKIGLCFSYAAKILPDHDGVPLVFSKEIKAQEVLGKPLGKSLFAEFERRGYDMSKKRIIVLNDTVTTLLAGLPKTKSEGCEGCIGFILGTGTNTAYIHENTIINEESGGLKFAVGDIDKEFFESTKDPSAGNFEKMISGAYLGRLAALILKKAIDEEVLYSGCKVPDDLDTIQMNAFLTHDDSVIVPTCERDQLDIYDILKAFVCRAAKLTATSLAAAVLATDYGKTRPVLINADGTTFYKTEFLERETKRYLGEFLAEQGRSAKFIRIENSPIIGSAIGALSLESEADSTDDSVTTNEN